MDRSPDLVIGPARCAAFHEAQAVDPVGSAGAFDAFLCVEVPGPWQREISLHEPYATLLAGAKHLVGEDGRLWRPQGLRCDGTSSHRSVLAFDRPPGPGRTVGAYRRRQWSVQPDDVLGLCAELLRGDGETPDHARHRVAVAEDTLDLLVCTHGRRDVCCGSLGTTLHAELVSAMAQHTSVRVWRTSHTGGHRFAPTALSFPDGYAWAHLDASLAELMASDSPLDPLVPHCRGLSSLPGAPAQVADRAVLAVVGRDWFAAERTLVVTEFERETMATTLSVGACWPDETAAMFEVVVAVKRHVPQITCGALEEPEYSVEPVWSVESFRTVRERS